LVSKEGHALKGKRGVVVNVLPRQSTPSGLKIEVEITDYDPNVPYPRVVFDYDDLKDLEYVSQFQVPAYSNELIPGIRPSYTPSKSPTSTSQSIALHLFSALRWSESLLRIHTCTRPCIRLLAPHQCGPQMLPSTPPLLGTLPHALLFGSRTQMVLPRCIPLVLRRLPLLPGMPMRALLCGSRMYQQVVLRRPLRQHRPIQSLSTLSSIQRSWVSMWTQ
jgi:hypothetical protein